MLLCNTYRVFHNNRPKIMAQCFISKSRVLVYIHFSGSVTFANSAIGGTHRLDLTRQVLGDQLVPHGNPSIQNFRATKNGIQLLKTEQGPAHSSPQVQCRTEQQTVWDIQYVESQTQECETIPVPQCSTFYGSQCKPVKRQECSAVQECKTKYQKQCSTQYKYVSHDHDKHNFI